MEEREEPELEDELLRLEWEDKDEDDCDDDEVESSAGWKSVTFTVRGSALPTPFKAAFFLEIGRLGETISRNFFLIAKRSPSVRPNQYGHPNHTVNLIP